MKNFENKSGNIAAVSAMDKNNKKFICQHYGKGYATKDGIFRHSIAEHQMQYDRRTTRTTPLTGDELATETQKLRKMQYSGKNRAAFVPTSEPYQKRTGK